MDTHDTAEDRFWKFSNKEKSLCDTEYIQRDHFVFEYQCRMDVQGSENYLSNTGLQSKYKPKVGSLYITGLLTLNIRSCVYLN